jgi:hypothetical protein
VPDGRRTGDKINRREAEVIVDEIKHIIETPNLATKGAPGAWRSIGVISLIGSKQAALINRIVLEAIGEELVMPTRSPAAIAPRFRATSAISYFYPW